MKISEIKKQALGALKGNWGLAVLATFVFFLIYMVVPLIIEIPLSGGFTAWINADEAAIGADIFNIIFSIILIPFSIAFYWFFLSLLRSEAQRFHSCLPFIQIGRLL